MTLGQLETTLDAAEYDRWMEFWSVEGFGEGKADLRAGIIAATIANCHRGRSVRAFTAQDFMPMVKKPGENKIEFDILKMDLFFGIHNQSLKK